MWRIADSLISMYEDKDLISQGLLTIYPPSENPAEVPIICIENFIPLAYEDQKQVRKSAKSGKECYFAEDAGTFFWVPVSESRQMDAPVFSTECDGNVRKVADSVDEFLGRPRIYKKNCS